MYGRCSRPVLNHMAFLLILHTTPNVEISGDDLCREVRLRLDYNHILVTKTRIDHVPWHVTILVAMVSCVSIFHIRGFVPSLGQIIIIMSYYFKSHLHIINGHICTLYNVIFVCLLRSYLHIIYGHICTLYNVIFVHYLRSYLYII